jgi:acetyltransferase-like isoleucine patch superfamily enzyme
MKILLSFRKVSKRVLYLQHRFSTRVHLLIWTLIYDLKVGHGTDFKGIGYIDTTQGKIEIGDNCQINAFGLAGPIVIGNNVLVNHFSDISGRDAKVIIGNNVLIAPHVSIMASTHNYKEKHKLIRLQGTSSADVVIGDDVWIGLGSVILPGIKIGTGSVIGANSVVTKDIPENSVAVGAPARVISTRQ